jgi:hypothetical protein
MTPVWQRIPRGASRSRERSQRGGSPGSVQLGRHSPRLATLSATAVMSRCGWVLASPRYLAQRRPHRRMACVCVPSIPARRAYSTVNWAVSCRCRAAWIASWKACGRTVSWRGAPVARVHVGRTGQARPVAAWNRMRTTGSPETSRPGVHLMLVCPWGQRACGACQAITRALTSTSLPSCPPLMEIGPKGRADHVGLMRGVGGDEAFGIDIAAVEQVRAGEEVTRGQVSVDGRAHHAIRHGRGVVRTWVMRCGWPSSQV